MRPVASAPMPLHSRAARGADTAGTPLHYEKEAAKVRKADTALRAQKGAAAAAQEPVRCKLQVCQTYKATSYK